MTETLTPALPPRHTHTQHRIENALAFYDKVVDIWYKFLASVRNDTELAESLSESQLQEVRVCA